MTAEILGTSDGVGASINSGPFGHSLATALHHGTALSRPMDLIGYSLDHLIHLYNTRNAQGQRVVSLDSLEMAQTPQRNPIALVVRDAARNIKQIIYDHNCRTNSGGTWQSILMGGDINANLGVSNTSTSVTYTATTVTPGTVPGWSVNQWVDHVVVAPTTTGTSPTFVYGVVISNTSTALTVDQWTTVGSATGASGTNPAANCYFVILPGAAPAFWIALSSDTTTEDIGNTTLPGEFTTGFSTSAGRWKGAYTQTTVPSGTGTTNSNSVYKVDTGTLTANTTVTVAKLGLFTTQNGGNLKFVKKLTTAASLINLDTLDAYWSITCS